MKQQIQTFIKGFYVTTAFMAFMAFLGATAAAEWDIERVAEFFCWAVGIG